MIKRIKKISVTLTRRRVIRMETAATTGQKMTPHEPLDVRETEQARAAPAIPCPTKPPC